MLQQNHFVTARQRSVAMISSPLFVGFFLSIFCSNGRKKDMFVKKNIFLLIHKYCVGVKIRHRPDNFKTDHSKTPSPLSWARVYHSFSLRTPYIY